MTSPDTDKPAARRPTIPHLPALDGLRGLAVFGVLLFHDGRLPGGYLGVDLFFVLSGYLITSLLLAEWAIASKIDLANFWIRRARRLFPALLSLLPAVALYAVTLAKPAELLRIRWDGFATLAYVANWRAIFAGRSYWDMFEAPSPLEHTWSLAIEEQFYVLWPLLTVAILKLSRGSKRAMFATCLGLGILSTAALYIFGTSNHGTDRAYLGTDTRGGAILFGAALACVMSGRNVLSSRRALIAMDVAGIFAAILLAIAWVRLDGQHALLYRGGFLATELAVLVLIVNAAQGAKSILGRALAFRPLIWMGLISYGLYLWHWPIYVVLSPDRIHLSGLPLTVLRLATTFAVSIVSYKYLEQPIRKNGLPFGKPIWVLPAVIGICSGLLVMSTRYIATARKVFHTLPWTQIVPPGTKSVLVVGDSVAQALGERLRAMQGPFKVMIAERGTPNCSILEGTLPTLSLSNVPHEGGDCDASWQKDAAMLRPDIALVILGGGHFAPVKIEDTWQRPCADGWTKAYGGELEEEVRKMVPYAGQIWMTRVPYALKHWQTAERDGHIDCFNRMVGDVAARIGNIRVLDLAKHLCPSGSASCATESAGFPIRPDGLHFAGDGAKETANWVLEQITRPR